jgi:DNA (cytosine-5)-methyltransferase 1
VSELVNLKTVAHLAARTATVGDNWEVSPLGLRFPSRRRRRYDRPVAVDFFAGAGGFSMGFHQAGFHVAAAVEAWPTAALTYLANLARPGVRMHFDTQEREAEFAKGAAEQLGIVEDPDGTIRPDPKRRGLGLNRHGHRIGGAGMGWIAGRPMSEPGCEHFFLWDIRTLNGRQILDALELEVGDIAVVMGGPPCQGFSLAGKQNVMDSRNTLVLEYARLICELMPRSFVMENVVGIESMVTPEGLPVLDAFAVALDDGGYGEYEALRRALAGREKAVAGVRGAKKAKRGKNPTSAKKARGAGAEVTQMDLLAEVST